MKSSPSPWANRAVWIGVFVAATIGASVGVLAALTHNSAEESVPPAPEHPAFARTSSPTTAGTTSPPGASPTSMHDDAGVRRRASWHAESGELAGNGGDADRGRRAEQDGGARRVAESGATPSAPRQRTTCR